MIVLTNTFTDSKLIKNNVKQIYEIIDKLKFITSYGSYLKKIRVNNNSNVNIKIPLYKHTHMRNGNLC